MMNRIKVNAMATVMLLCSLCNALKSQNIEHSAMLEFNSGQRLSLIYERQVSQESSVKIRPYLGLRMPFNIFLGLRRSLGIPMGINGIIGNGPHHPELGIGLFHSFDFDLNPFNGYYFGRLQLKAGYRYENQNPIYFRLGLSPLIGPYWNKRATNEFDLNLYFALGYRL